MLTQNRRKKTTKIRLIRIYNLIIIKIEVFNLTNNNNKEEKDHLLRFV